MIKDRVKHRDEIRTAPRRKCGFTVVPREPDVLGRVSVKVTNLKIRIIVALLGQVACISIYF